MHLSVTERQGAICIPAYSTHVVETGKILEHRFEGFAFPWRQTTLEILDSKNLGSPSGAGSATGSSS